MSAFHHICQGGNASLVEAALEFAQDEYPDLNVSIYLRVVERMAARFLRRLALGMSDLATLDCLNEYFFGELAFTGNTENYYDPRNSYLNEVLDRRVGIPISLGVLYQHLAAAAGIRLKGVNFPGHFLLRYEREDGHIYIDVFHGGSQLSWQECRLRLMESMDGDYEPCERDLPPMTNREILLRMLRNLKGIYSRSHLSRCLTIQERIVAISPNLSDEMRDLGILYFHAGKPLRAIRTLEQLIRDNPHMPQKEVATSYLHRATREAVLLN